MKVILDYAHNAAGLETLGEFVDRLASDSAVPERPGEAARAANLVVGVVATAGDRRDDDMRQLGRVAARHFDIVIVREDRNPRGRAPGETAALVVEGVREAIDSRHARAGTVEIVLDEMDAARKALDRARPGDVVVLCVDYATEVYKELEKRRGSATPAALRASEAGMIEAVGGDVDLIDLSGITR
jgi:cyanophycin synthetase